MIFKAGDVIKLSDFDKFNQYCENNPNSLYVYNSQREYARIGIKNGKSLQIVNMIGDGGCITVMDNMFTIIPTKLIEAFESGEGDENG